MGKSSIHGPCSIAMLKNRRVIVENSLSFSGPTGGVLPLISSNVNWMTKPD